MTTQQGIDFYRQRHGELRHLTEEQEKRVIGTLVYFAENEEETIKEEITMVGTLEELSLISPAEAETLIMICEMAFDGRSRK